MKNIIIKILKKYKIQFVIVWTFIAINMYLLTIPPQIIGKIVDLLYNIEGNKELIVRQAMFLVLSAIGLLLVRMPWRYSVGIIVRGFEKDLKNKLFDQFMKIKMVQLQTIKNGEFMSYFTKDIGEMRVFLYRAVSLGSRIIAILIMATYQMMTGVNVKLTLVTMCPIIVTSYLVVRIKKYVEISFKKSQKCYTAMSEFVQESTDSIKTTKAYSGEMSQLKEFIKRNRFLKQANNAVDVHSTLLSTCINICFGLCYGISLIYGSKLVLEGTITTGEFIAFNGYIGLFVNPVSWIPGLISRFKRAQISYQRLSKVFELEREKVSVSNLKSENLISGDIVIKDLTYNYTQNIEVALNHINLEIKEGETLGIIGTIGSGKTTLMNLLLKLYPVPDGKITIGGKDINDIPLGILRKSICYITQDAFLFSSTLKDNICLFRDDYEDDEIMESTKKAIISDEINKMEEGIYTEIGGPRGVDLSGGQKQRVVVSRAFLQKSNIVIFDDTFCALDNRTEEALLKNIKELTKGKTCIIISNRISDVKDADKIIVLDEGNMIEVGNHETLINRRGLYNKLYSQQSSKEEAIID